MGDRCYMSITCRRQDQDRFTELGFQIEYEEEQISPIIQMADPEANYGHYDEMPTNIPYYGEYNAGANYGPGSVACDGQEYADLPGSSDGFVVEWNFRTGLPTLRSIKRIRQYLKVERQAKKLFKKLKDQHQNQSST